MHILVTIIEEKDAFINELQKKMKEMETKFTTENKFKDAKLDMFEKKLDNLLNENEIMSEKLNKVELLQKNNEQKFKCKDCKFTTASEQGLKTHVTKKHKAESKKLENLQFPSPCDLCNKELKSKSEMIKHMRTHSYKCIQFKCDKCEFWGSEDITMEVHAAKYHGDNFECALCEYIAKDLETLETHLATCEIYICNICDNRLKSLSDLKTHFVQKHKPEDKSRSVTHVKQSRKSKEEYDDEKIYLYTHLLNDL